MKGWARVLGLSMIVLSTVTVTAWGQAVIKVSDDVSLRFGMMTQFQAQFTEDRSTAAQDTSASYTKRWARNMFLRRMRFFLGGTVGKEFNFFLMTDDPNYGQVSSAGSKSQGAANPMYVQEVYMSYVPMTEFSVIAGMQLIGITRNGMQSASTLGTVDYGSYSFTQSTPTNNLIGRDVGVTFRGFLAEERLEYRAGVYSGVNRNIYSPFRYVGWVNYSFLDKEKGIYYTGNTLGKGKMFSVGLGVDLQRTYTGIGGAVFVDYPVTEKGSLVANLNAQLLDGGVDSTRLSEYTQSLPKQFNFLGELGYYFSEYKIEPFVRVDVKSVNVSDKTQFGLPASATSTALDNRNKLNSESRFGLGFIYWFLGHNSNLKLYLERIMYKRPTLDGGSTESKSQNQVTVQWQWHFY